jgi:CubicO group peptidase (beta-lactamase class C family)
MDQVIEAIEQLAAETEFSGAIRVDRDAQTLFAKAYGLAHRGLEIPNAANTRFAIASGAKGFTALTAVSLIVDGALSLDTTARSVLGDQLPLINDSVTIQHLLSHTSGIGDYLDEEDDSLGPIDYAMATPVHQLATTAGFLQEIDGHPTKFAPGTRFSYSNGGYIVLALIIERVGGVGYHDAVQERVIKPARLADTAFLRSDEPADRMALGYLEPTGLRTNVLHLPVRGNGDGGIYTTVANMRMFWDALFAGHIVPEGWVAAMTHPHSEVPEKRSRYGLGFWLAENGPTVQLVGADAGVSFSSVHDPTTQSTSTVISNTTSGAWPIVRHLRSALQDPQE